MDKYLMYSELARNFGTAITPFVIIGTGYLISRKIESIKDQNLRKNSFASKWADGLYVEEQIFINNVYSLINVCHKLQKDRENEKLATEFGEVTRYVISVIPISQVKLENMMRLIDGNLAKEFIVLYEEFEGIVYNSKGIISLDKLRDVALRFVQLFKRAHESAIHTRTA